MLVCDENVINIAITENYNMQLFYQYLLYQRENIAYYPGRWAVEKLAYSMSRACPECYPFSSFVLDWCARWNRFDSYEELPDCLCFLKYCEVRGFNPYYEQVLERKAN